MLDEMSSVIRHFLVHRHGSYVDPPISPKRVSMVAMKIRYLIEQLVPVEVKVISLPRRDFEFQPSWITQPHSRAVKKRVLRLVWEAGADDSACIVYALLICRKYAITVGKKVLSVFRYFRRMAQQDLVEAGLHNLRKLASEHTAKLIIDSISDGHELIELLLRRSFWTRRLLITDTLSCLMAPKPLGSPLSNLRSTCMPSGSFRPITTSNASQRYGVDTIPSNTMTTDVFPSGGIKLSHLQNSSTTSIIKGSRVSFQLERSHCSPALPERPQSFLHTPFYSLVYADCQ